MQLFFVLLATPLSARAQLPDAVAASRSAWLQAATQARDSGEHERALDFAMRAGRVEMTPSLRLFIAQEQRYLRRHVAALSAAQQCLRELDRPSRPNNADVIRALCERIRSETLAHVGQLTLELEGIPQETLQVRIGNEELPRIAWGLPYVVDPGRIHLVVRTPERVYLDELLTVTPGSRHTLRPDASGRAPTGSESARPATESWWTRAGAGPFALAGIGAAALLATLPLGLTVNAETSAFLVRANEFCRNSDGVWICPTASQPRVGAPPELLAITTNILWSTGAALVATGTIWLLAAPARTPSTERTAVRFVPSVSGLLLRGAF